MADTPWVTTTSAAPRTTSIGGLRVFAAPVDGPVRAALSFRVGWADETLADHGISHLVEHLVLAPLGQPNFAWNGATSPERVTFWCEGTEDQVNWFLSAVATNVAALPLQHLAMEKNLISAEACHRSGSVVGVHDLWRWGTQGHGLGAYHELGLHHLSPERVTAWAARFLTAENGCLWTTSASVQTPTLPRGVALPAPEPTRWRATPTPSSFVAEGTRVSMSGELRYGQWAGVIGHVLQRRLMERLRYRDGISYSADYDVTSVGRDLRRLLVTIDGLPDRMTDVAAGAFAVLHDLARTGPTTAELSEVADAYASSLQGEQAVLAELSRLSDDYLLGRPSRSPQELLGEIRSLTPETVAGSVASMLPTVLWSVPPEIEVPETRPAPIWSTHRVIGTRYTPPPGHLQDTYVEMADEGLTQVFEGSDGAGTVTIGWDDCTAAVAFDDGSRQLIGRDGMSITLLPELWGRWEELRSAVDRRVPTGSWAPQGPAPHREPPRPPTAEAQVTSDAVWVALGLSALLVAALVAYGSLVDGADPGGLTVAVAMSVLGLLPLERVRRRHARRAAGLETRPRRRYRGAAAWPTRYVVVGAVASVAGAVTSLLVGAWLLVAFFVGTAVRSVSELSRRAGR